MVALSLAPNGCAAAADSATQPRTRPPLIRPQLRTREDTTSHGVAYHAQERADVRFHHSSDFIGLTPFPWRPNGVSLATAQWIDQRENSARQYIEFRQTRVRRNL